MSFELTRYAAVSTLSLGLIAACGALGCHGAEHHDHDHPEADPDSHSAPHEPGAGPPADGALRVERSMLRDLRITTSAAELRPAGDTVNALGELTVDEERYAEIGSPIAGRVASVLVSAGDRVRKGQPLAELDSPELGQARAERVRAQLRVEQARRIQSRRQALAADKIVPQRELESSQAELSEAEAQLMASGEILASLGASGGGGTRLQLRSPIDGTVVERHVLRGRSVDAASSLFVVGDLTRLWLVAHAFERDAVRVRTGRTARVSFPALPGREFSGEITRVGSRVDPLSRTIDVRIEIDNSDGALRPGMSATASIPVGDESVQIVTVPLAALQRLPQGWCVFLPRDEEGVFEARVVGRGRDLAGEVEIVHGLNPGERVVVDGAFLLKAESDKARGGGAEHHH